MGLTSLMGARWWSTLASPRSRSGSTARRWCWTPGSLHRAAGRLRVKVASVTVPGARYQAPHGLEAVAERTTDGDRETSQLPRISGGPLGEDEDRRVDLGLLPSSRVGRSGRLSDGGKLTRNGRCRSLGLVRCCPRSSIAACGVIGRRTQEGSADDRRRTLVHGPPGGSGDERLGGRRPRRRHARPGLTTKH